MMNGCTAYPWYIQGIVNGKVFVASEILNTDNLVATVEGYTTKELSANANLIAAAPEMLEALKAQRYAKEVNAEYARQDAGHLPSKGWPELSATEVLMVRERAEQLSKRAITKAEGKV
jgi:hypothetical protein